MREFEFSHVRERNFAIKVVRLPLLLRGIEMLGVDLVILQVSFSNLPLEVATPEWVGSSRELG